MQYVASTAAVTILSEKERVVLAVAPAAKIGFQLVELGVSFNATAVTEPCVVQLFKSKRDSKFGFPETVTTVKSVAVTLAQIRGAGNTGKQSESIEATCLASEAYSEAEAPTVIEVLKTWYVSPTAGLVYQAPLGREPEAPPSASSFAMGIRVLASKAEVKCRAYMEIVQGPS